MNSSTLSLSVFTSDKLLKHLTNASLGCALLLPWLLLHFLAGVEIAIDVIAISFLVRSAIAHNWAWLSETWVRIGLAWWAWLLLCTLLNLPEQPAANLVQAAAVLRFLVFVAALEQWTLADSQPRTWFFWSLAAATLYVALQTLLQFATGHNLFGDPRSGDGELTGPFRKPRAGPSFVRMLFPVLVPAGCAALARPGRGALLAAIVVFAAALAVVVLIGQRMPVLLGAFGLLLMALLLPRLRAPVIVALVAGGALIAASAVVSPPTFYRLVTKFSHQMEDWPDSHYGQITARSLAITGQSPIIGRGYDGFASGCALPRYFEGWHWPGHPTADQGGGAAMCVTHPHSFYLQAMTDAGLPGLILFSALVAVWLWRIGRGLLPNGSPYRVGLFVAAIIQFFPIASTSPIISIPIGAWCFLLLGVALAEARADEVLAEARADEVLAEARADRVLAETRSGRLR